ncbi:MAG TPA: PP2C family protein-serine/threonine phosphatase [Thermoanaerobaculia bacterium]|nr:PP2C family protein-serine/threonine phosphatase [Thermoanaerobaculia bacterium]
MSFRIARARLPLRRRDLVGWLALLLVGALALGWGYRRAFPLAPVDWRIGKHEAIRIVEQRIRDLGAGVADPYVSAALVADPVLELRLREAARDADPAVLRASRLGEQLQRWRVSVYEGGARVEEWSYLAEVALDGEVVSLLRGTPDAFESAATLDFATARARADSFLAEQGVDLATLAEPVERRVDLGSFSYQFVRYRESAPVLRGILDYGVEVRFAGDELQGFYTWTQDAGGALLQNRLRPATLAQTSRIVVLFLLLPGIAVLFVRRYHQGVMGVRRGVEVFAAIFFAGAVVVAMTARSAADGSNFGALSRAQVTWVQLAFVLLIYLPALAALGLMSCSIGESACSGSWRSRLAAFDGLWRGRWSNSTVAASALRGVAAGVALAALLQALAAAVPAAGAVPLFALQLGPLWQDAALPGVALLLLFVAFTLAYGCLLQLLLQPWMIDRLGVPLGGGLVALVGGLLLWPAIGVVPTGWGLPLWILTAAAPVALFIRYDLLAALLAALVAQVVVHALPLLHARDAGLEAQGWIAVLGAAAPLWWSLRWLGGSEVIQYRYDDVPPHVRRIAERERQRVELETARSIQSSILPKVPESLLGVDLAVVYLPASEVGGDFYDVLELANGRLAVAIGDVAGHGVSSGLIMSMARSALSVQASFRPEVPEVFRTLNRVIHESAQRRLLTTLCYAVLDPASGRLQMASAGHVYPYRVSVDGGVEVLESTAYPLGVRPRLEVSPRDVQLAPGDCLFFTSDGLVETRRLGGDEPFGFDRLERSLQRHAGHGARRLCDGVLGDLERFAGSGAELAPELVWRDDDLTVLVLHFAGAAGRARPARPGGTGGPP